MRYLFVLPENEHLRRAVVGQLKDLGYEFMASDPEKEYVKSKLFDFLRVASSNPSKIYGASIPAAGFEIVPSSDLLSNPDKYRFEEEFKSAADGTKYFQEYKCGHVNYLNHVMTKQKQVKLVERGKPQNQICYAYKGEDLVSVWTKCNGNDGAHVYADIQELEDAVKVLKNLRDMS